MVHLLVGYRQLWKNWGRKKRLWCLVSWHQPIYHGLDRLIAWEHYVFTHFDVSVFTFFIFHILFISLVFFFIICSWFNLFRLYNYIDWLETYGSFSLLSMLNIVGVDLFWQYVLSHIHRWISRLTIEWEIFDANLFQFSIFKCQLD